MAFTCVYSGILHLWSSNFLVCFFDQLVFHICVPLGGGFCGSSSFHFKVLYFSIFWCFIRGKGKQSRILEISNDSELIKYLIRFILKSAFLMFLNLLVPSCFFRDHRNAYFILNLKSFMLLWYRLTLSKLNVVYRKKKMVIILCHSLCFFYSPKKINHWICSNNSLSIKEKLASGVHY